MSRKKTSGGADPVKKAAERAVKSAVRGAAKREVKKAARRIPLKYQLGTLAVAAAVIRALFPPGSC